MTAAGNIAEDASNGRIVLLVLRLCEGAQSLAYGTIGRGSVFAGFAECRRRFCPDSEKGDLINS